MESEEGNEVPIADPIAVENNAEEIQAEEVKAEEVNNEEEKAGDIEEIKAADGEIEEAKTGEVEIEVKVEGNEVEVKDPDYANQVVEENAEEKPNDELRIETPENLKVNGSEGEHEEKSQNFPMVHISLKSITKDDHKKSSVFLTIADSLFEKDAAERSKINSFRQKVIASEVDQLRQVPETNPNSKKILNQKKHKEISKKLNQEKLEKEINIDRYSSKLHDTSNLSSLNNRLRLKTFDGINPEVMAESLKIRENFNKEKLEKEQAAKEIIKKVKDYEERQLEECSFKPQLFERVKGQGSIVIKHSKSGTLNIGGKKKLGNVPQVVSVVSVKDLGSRIPPPNKKHETVIVGGPQGQASIVTDKYAQLSPFLLNVRHKSGYNQEEIMAKGQPMVDYRDLSLSTNKD